MRKERQLCRQIQETVAEALASLNDDLLLSVWVSDVEPSPDASRLAVTVRAPASAPLPEIEARLCGVRAYLRSEVAGAITRKRAPTLIFRVLPGEGS